MPTIEHTAHRNLPYPVGVDFVKEGPENFEELALGVDEENAGDVDFLQAGAVSAADWSFTATIENSSTCTITAASAGGTAWLPQATVGLLRSVTATGSAVVHALKPGTLPANGKYMSVAVCLEAAKWGQAATVSVVSGVEQSTLALAEANPATVPSSKLRVRDLYIKNNAGTYALEGQLDRRTWATYGHFLNLIAQATSCTAKSGELVKATGSITVTLPEASVNATVGVLANGHAVTVKAPAGDIYGDFVEGVTSINLIGYQHVVLQSDGTNWFIIAGEPKREQVAVGKDFSKAELEAGVTPSTTRPALVTFFGNENEAHVEVEGVLIGPPDLGEHVPLTFEVLPGQKWKAKVVGHAVTLLK